jgi:transposase-like protein
MTLKHRRKFTREFKLQVLAEIAAGRSVAQTAREHQLHPILQSWLAEVVKPSV